jgi:hypothetical protein
VPTWGEILSELSQTLLPNGIPDFDGVRRKYLALAEKHTGRNLILYATAWMQPPANVPPDVLSIHVSDVHGLMEVIHGLEGPSLDLILHSPGGSPTAAEAIVTYLRSKFSDLRIIVPYAAMSAATMIACAADKLMLGKHSFLGPIDPQLLVQTPLGVRMVPAQAVIQQFRQAQVECQDQRNLAAWLPMLSQYGPDILVQCENASKLSKDLVTSWLKQYMLKKDPQKAEEIAEWLAKHDNFMTHARQLSRDVLESKGLNIEKLEDDQTAQDLFLSIFHAAVLTLSSSGTVKLIENHLGKCMATRAGVIQVIPQQQGPQQQPQQP